MTSKTKWINGAIRGLRSFAYGPDQGNSQNGRPRVGLALGGGFARGIAHLGVMRVLEDNDIPLHCIAGTSVGALVGAAYASGATTDDMAKQGIETTFHDFGRWTLSRMGMASNERLEHFLHKFTTARTFEELKIPMAIVATDLLAGQSVYFCDGEIAPALRASCAYPGLFLPIQYRNHFLVDGFLTESVPTGGARFMGADYVIGVNLEPGLLHESPRNTIEVIPRSFSVIQTQAQGAWRKAADIVIEPDVHGFLWDDFAKTPQLIAAGETATRAVLPQIKQALASRAH